MMSKLMTTTTSLLIAVGLTLLIGCAGEPPSLQPGDILLQEIRSAQGEALRLATDSRYTHCGVVLERPDGELVIYEAVHPVMTTPVTQWISRGSGAHYTVMRLQGADTLLTGDVLADMRAQAAAWLGTDYDSYYAWGDDKLYCSEYVWKLFDRAAGVQLCELRQLRDFNLSHPVVKAKLAERYGANVPLDEWVVAPSDLHEASSLEEIYSGRLLPQ